MSAGLALVSIAYLATIGLFAWLFAKNPGYAMIAVVVVVILFGVSGTGRLL